MIEPGRTYWYVNKPSDVDAAHLAGVPGARASGCRPLRSPIGRSWSRWKLERESP